MNFLLSVFLLVVGFVGAAKLDLRTVIAKNDKDELAQAMLHPDIDKRINVRNAHTGQTPLMSAVLSGKTNAVEALLTAGADATIAEKDGYTPMHGAGFQGRADIVPILAAHGIPLIDFHKDGYAPIHRACWGRESRHAETVAAFITAGVPHDLRALDGKTCFDATMNRKTLNILKKEKEKELTVEEPSL